MKVILFETAQNELRQMDNSVKKSFIKHIEKLQAMPPGRHLRFGIPWHVEEVTKQARLIYKIEDECLYIQHCFATHKEYEKWYKTYK